jgi:hypothetical protein
VDFEEISGNAEVHLEWTGPGLPRQLVRPLADGAFHGVYPDAGPEASFDPCRPCEMKRRSAEVRSSSSP